MVFTELVRIAGRESDSPALLHAGPFRRQAGERLMANVTLFLERKLRPEVNAS